MVQLEAGTIPGNQVVLQLLTGTIPGNLVVQLIAESISCNTLVFWLSKVLVPQC